MTATHNSLVQTDDVSQKRRLFGHELRRGQTVTVLEPIQHGGKIIAANTVIEILDRIVGNYFNVRIVTVDQKGGSFQPDDTVYDLDGLSVDDVFYGTPPGR